MSFCTLHLFFLHRVCFLFCRLLPGVTASQEREELCNNYPTGISPDSQPSGTNFRVTSPGVFSCPLHHNVINDNVSQISLDPAVSGHLPLAAFFLLFFFLSFLLLNCPCRAATLQLLDFSYLSRVMEQCPNGFSEP